MNILQEIERVEKNTKAMIDVLGGNLSTLQKAKAVLMKGEQPSQRAKARKTNRDMIMHEIARIDQVGGKPKIAKRK